MAAGSAAKNTCGAASIRAGAVALGPHPFEEPVHRRLRQRVVGDDVVRRDAERAEHERRQQTGSVLARRAVEDGRQGVGVGEHPERGGETRCAFGEHRRVRPVEELRGGQVLGAGQFPIPGRVDDGQVVERDRVGLEREATALVDLARPPQVDDRLQGDRTQRLEIIGRQPAEPVGSEQRPPTQRTAVLGRVPAEVAEVEDAVEVDVAAWREIGHCLDRIGCGSKNRQPPDDERMNSGR